MALTFLQKTPSTDGLTTYTFSAQNLGEAASDRYIIVAVTARAGGAANRVISAVTIGGVSASIAAQTTNGTGNNSSVAGLAIAAVPEGATGDIVVTFDGAMLRAGIAAWRVTGLASATPTDTGTSTASAPTTSLDVAAGGFAIGVAFSAVSTAFAWTGLDEDFDDPFHANATYTGASKTFEEAQEGLTITATPSSNLADAGVFASWALSTAPTLTSVTVSPATVTLAPEGTRQLTATAHYDDDSTEDVTATATWASDDETVATVSETGLVTAQTPETMPATANITATVDAVESDPCVVTVREGGNAARRLLAMGVLR